MAAEQSLQKFARIAIVMEIFFAIIYGFHEGYTTTVQYSDFNGLLVAIFLVMLLLIGKPSFILRFRTALGLSQGVLHQRTCAQLHHARIHHTVVLPRQEILVRH